MPIAWNVYKFNNQSLARISIMLRLVNTIACNCTIFNWCLLYSVNMQMQAYMKLWQLSVISFISSLVPLLFKVNFYVISGQNWMLFV